MNSSRNHHERSPRYLHIIPSNILHPKDGTPNTATAQSSSVTIQNHQTVSLDSWCLPMGAIGKFTLYFCPIILSAQMAKLGYFGARANHRKFVCHHKSHTHIDIMLLCCHLLFADNVFSEQTFHLLRYEKCSIHVYEYYISD